MHPLLRNPRALSGYLLAWMLAACLPALAWSPGAPAEWGFALAFVLPVAALAGLAALSMYAVCRAFPLRPARWTGALARRAAAAALLALALGGAAALWNAMGVLWGRGALLALGAPAWLALVAMAAAAFAIAALLHDALLAQQAVQRAKATEAGARLLAREMEIKALRHQLDPHFLFNSLNSVSSLIPLDPAAARAMTIDLAQFFRQTRMLGERERVHLEEELDLIGHYLAIEQRRLEDRLRVCVEVDAACSRAWVPPLVLQPLVENAIKHGIRPLVEGGVIEIGARRRGAQLALRISNPVPAAAPRDASGLGHGLRLLRERLQAQYEERAFVDVEAAPERFTVRIALPWQT